MKKKSVGIIAEYNPFHNGHLYHLNESKKLTDAEISIVAMSGNFVQRGQVAIADKWKRAEAAVKCGADLVVEIPVAFACNSAPYFAKAGTEILENLGIDYLSFGSESGNIEELKAISREMKDKNEEIEEYIKEAVKNGLAYPRAREDAIRELIGPEAAELINNPNNILALEYLKNVESAEVVTVKRQGPGYNDLNTCNELASATAIRYLMEEKEDVTGLMPQESASVILDCRRPSEEILFKLICYKVFTTSAKELDEICAGGEGLGNKLKNSIRKVSSYEELINELKSKRYTRTRIERFLIQVLLDIKEPDNMPNYIRVLAFNKKGSAYLKSIKKLEICKLPIITNINKELEDFPQILSTVEKDILATDIYNLITDRDLYKNSEYVVRPYTMT